MKFQLEFKFLNKDDWCPVMYGPAPYTFDAFHRAKTEADALEQRGFATRILQDGVVVYDSTYAD